MPSGWEATLLVDRGIRAVPTTVARLAYWPSWAVPVLVSVADAPGARNGITPIWPTLSSVTTELCRSASPVLVTT